MKTQIAHIKRSLSFPGKTKKGNLNFHVSSSFRINRGSQGTELWKATCRNTTVIGLNHQRLKQDQTRIMRILRMNILGDTYSAKGPERQEPVLRSSPVTAVSILPLLQDVLLALEVCLLIAHPATRTKHFLLLLLHMF